MWRALQKISLGRTATYSEVARALGQPRAVRAVAQACAANNLALIVPCHRVIREDGDLAGYRWGVERKRALLERERAAAAADEAAVGGGRARRRDRLAGGGGLARRARLRHRRGFARCRGVPPTGQALPDDDAFRSRVVMQRHGYGRGEYKYFGYPLPAAVEALRRAIYPHLAPIADRWHRRLREAGNYPAALDAYLAQCHRAGQQRPTPLILNTAPATTTACTRIFMARWSFRCS